MTAASPGSGPFDRESSVAFTLHHLDLHHAHPVVVRIEYGAEFGPLPNVVAERWRDKYGLPVPSDLVRDDPRLIALIETLADQVIGTWGPGAWPNSWDRPVRSVYAVVTRAEGAHVWITDYDGREALLASATPIVQVTGDGPRLLSTPPGDPLPLAQVPLLLADPW